MEEFLHKAKKGWMTNPMTDGSEFNAYCDVMWRVLPDEERRPKEQEKNIQRKLKQPPLRGTLQKRPSDADRADANCVQEEGKMMWRHLPLTAQEKQGKYDLIRDTPRMTVALVLKVTVFLVLLLRDNVWRETERETDDNNEGEGQTGASTAVRRRSGIHCYRG
ncbi:Hypothetical predicted protein [Xyrichtys novacula]|uniref:Uncharacterized protein n=1 Tax=Xyrichtys novacula TaxID=13765 RepID=A0AAV1GM76_XYRNO|nr:Hypothetical predicted protein [Xyrichtys novacula]